MSGLFCIFNRDGSPVEGAAVEALSQALRHRGPDGIATWSTGNAALGHFHLATVPESVDERQPRKSADGSLTLVADCRIDNREELWREVGRGERLDGTVPDSEIILRCYEKWQEGAPGRLLGDFAFIVWDAGRRRVFCARDHAGIRPLYYHVDQRRLVAASEVSALLDAGLAPRELDEGKLAECLVGFFEDKEHTVIRDVMRLLPATWMKVDSARVEKRAYWALEETEKVSLRRDEDYYARFRELFEESIRCRMRGIKLPGVELSGGLDSSGIASVARGMALESGQSLCTYTNVFPTVSEEHPEIDERGYVRDLIARGGIDPHFVNSEGIDPLNDQVLDVQECYLAPNMFLSAARYAALGRDGVRIILSGHDGDSILSHGYERLSQLMRQGRWLAARREIDLLSRNMGKNMSWVWKECCLKSLVPETLLRTMRAMRGRSKHGLTLVKGVIHPEFAKRVQLRERLNQYRNPNNVRGWDMSRMHAAGIRCGLNLLGLEYYNQLGARMGVETCFPFFDRRILEFCIHVPCRLKLHEGKGRYYYRRALEDVLPESIGSRSDKGNLSSNFNRNFYAKSRGVIAEALDNAGTFSQYLDIERARRLFAHAEANPEAARQFSCRIFWTVGTHRWLERRVGTAQEAVRSVKAGEPGAQEAAEACPVLRLAGEPA